MTGPITRRDFLNGTALVIAGGLTPLAQLRAEPARYYPPALTGLRGSHPGSFETAHQLGREGKHFDVSGLPAEESWDLVVVGGGISGLATAWFWREAHGPSSRILVLDNHDDFGGHAKRNEFRVDGRLLLGYGGSESLQSPKAMFSPVVKRVMKALGVTIDRWNTAYDRKLYASFGMREGVFFDKENFGTDRLVAGNPIASGADSVVGTQLKPDEVARIIGEYPFSDDAKARLVAFFTKPRDYLAGKSTAQKIEYLKRTSYRDYLRVDAGLGEEAVKFFDGRTLDFMAEGPDVVPALDAAGSRYPGFDGLALGNIVEPGLDEPYIYHFPDGNASLARLFVRSLVPAVAPPGHDMEDVLLAEFDYAKLDVEGAPVRIRLNSTAVAVANTEGGKGPVDLGYVTAGTLHRVRAKQVVLACYNMIIPYLMPELPAAQKEALAASVKMPLVYATVAIRNWHAWTKLGVDQIYCPYAFFSNAKLDYPVALGGYRNPSDPSEPILVHMVHIPHASNQGLSNVDQYRMGRMQLLETSFETFEAKIRDQLDRMLGGGGFRSDRDLAAITVNRWPHGYAYAENSLFDKERTPPLYEVARKRAGKVAIANSDAAWNAYAHEAIDQAWRAVGELRSA
jgi:spermidine dehydrogenase